MTTFQIGDRVRTLAAADGIPPGTVGTVDGIDPNAHLWPIGVQLDAKTNGYTHQIYTPSELELIWEPTVTKPTKIGDRVRYLGPIKGNTGEPVKPVGVLGTVASHWPFENGIGTSGDSLFVDWDDYSSGSTWMENVELVTESAPAPADENTQALRERLIEQAVKAVDFSADAATIVNTAKAFEAYITGGTK